MLGGMCCEWFSSTFNSINLVFSPDSYNRRQNELRHLALKGLSDIFLTSKEKNIAFPPPSPPFNVVPLFELPLENNKHPNFEWRGQGWGVDCYVLWSYPICVQCLNNFVVDCSYKANCNQSLATSFTKWQCSASDYHCGSNSDASERKLSFQWFPCILFFQNQVHMFMDLFQTDPAAEVDRQWYSCFLSCWVTFTQ